MLTDLAAERSAELQHPRILGEHVAEHGLEGVGPFQAARDLLLKRAPRVRGQALSRAGEAPLDAVTVRRVGAALADVARADGGTVRIIHQLSWAEFAKVRA